ncbi:TIGR03435 family protein [Granulicella tundricola]|uniref:Soil-associated protein, TIGR03435 family n=1 Tax=Granulicella tundricola (strain ATCC BAA-1859 / DSM 23138 / MP5ACTX9) TaxID=1198114 RepID=E8X254_GRATM|nr:TIGR03435 family protein [Granulicella tundricola]ADW70297.1 hypothetical protein AciX9_3286 [Granulicella tundricola MP5ACTX9]
MAAAVVVVAPIAIHAQVPLGQAAASYDVVSVKPNKSGPNGMSWGSTADGYRATNVSLGMLIQSAWNLKTEDLIYGLPKWDHDARFDVEGKMDADAVATLKQLPPKEARVQRDLMMQNMLIERFHLQIHHDIKQLPVYNLNVAKGGLKVKEADPANAYPEVKMGSSRVAGAGSMMFGPGQFTGNAVTLAALADNLSGTLSRLVIDKTGLTGKYDFALKYAPDDAPTTNDPGPSLFTALEEQLGLHLESTKGPVDTIVIDHLEQPTEN